MFCLLAYVRKSVRERVCGGEIGRGRDSGREGGRESGRERERESERDRERYIYICMLCFVFLCLAMLVTTGTAKLPNKMAKSSDL